MIKTQELIEKIALLKQNKHTLFIAIDGRGGSGKSTLANILKGEFHNVTIIHLDDIAHPNNLYRQELRELLEMLKNNKKVKYQKYDFYSQQFTEWFEVSPGGIVVVEGVSTLDNVLYKEYDLKIWLECPAEMGFHRGVKRDLMVHKRDTSQEWQKEWMPEEERYINEQKPQKRADYIIDSTEEFK